MSAVTQALIKATVAASHRVFLAVGDRRAGQREVAGLPPPEELPPTRLLFQLSVHRGYAVLQQPCHLLRVVTQKACPVMLDSAQTEHVKVVYTVQLVK